MRTIRLMLVTILAAVILSEGAPLRSGTAGPKAQPLQEQSDINNIADYYGFGEMETVKLDWGIHSPVIADFDGDGRNDIAIVNNSRAKIELLIQKPAVTPGETPVAVDPNDVDINVLVTPTRFDRQNVALSERVYSMVCGDLDSDGRPDLAYYGEPRGLYILLQSGEKGQPGKSSRLHWQTRRKIAIDDGLVTTKVLACADLNGDRADDLVLASHDGVYIILQKEDGSFAEAVKYPGIARALAVKAGDLNGDGINDIVVQTDDRDKPIEVRFGLKTKQLGPCVRLFVEQPLAIELKDIDGRPGDELLVVAAVSKRLICYKLAAAEQKDNDWPMLFYPLAAGEAASKRDLVVADVDGDGLGDVVISDPASAELVMYRQKPALGLAEPARFPAFADVQQLSAADVDGDGRTEIGMLSIKEKVCGVSKFENERLSFPKPIPIEGEPLAMELCDIDGDKAVDCVYASRSSEDVRSLRVVYSIGQNNDSPSEVGNMTALDIKTLTTNPDGLKVVDVDQDGLYDVLIFVKYELPILVRQTAKREFEIVASAGAQASLIKDAGLRSIAVANVDGKGGDELLVAQNNFARALVFSRPQGWRIVDQYNARSTENRITAAGVFEIEGVTGQYAPAIFILDAQKGQIQVLTAGQDKTYRFDRQIDVGNWSTGAGAKMLSAALTGTVATSILLFDGEKFAIVTPPGATGEQRFEQQFDYETKIKDGLYGNLAAGDINSDKLVDVIMVEYNRSHIEILALDSAGRPVPAMRFKVFEQKNYRDDEGRGPRSGVEPRDLKVADVTGDGKPDLVTVVHDRIIIYPQD